MAISSTPEKLQQVADEVGEQSGIASIPFIYVEGMKLKIRNVEVFQKVISGSNSFILGHPINGRLGVATGLGGGQIVLGQSGTDATTQLMKRAYEWKSNADFQRGTKTENIDTSQGFIQLGNVTVKNIYLAHKTK